MNFRTSSFFICQSEAIIFLRIGKYMDMYVHLYFLKKAFRLENYWSGHGIYVGLPTVLQYILYSIVLYFRSAFFNKNTIFQLDGRIFFKH